MLKKEKNLFHETAKFKTSLLEKIIYIILTAEIVDISTIHKK